MLTQSQVYKRDIYIYIYIYIFGNIVPKKKYHDSTIVLRESVYTYGVCYSFKGTSTLKIRFVQGFDEIKIESSKDFVLECFDLIYIING